jgi:hypothetical protein
MKWCIDNLVISNTDFYREKKKHYIEDWTDLFKCLPTFWNLLMAWNCLLNYFFLQKKALSSFRNNINILTKEIFFAIKFIKAKCFCIETVIKPFLSQVHFSAHSLSSVLNFLSLKAVSFTWPNVTVEIIIFFSWMV